MLFSRNSAHCHRGNSFSPLRYAVPAGQYNTPNSLPSYSFPKHIFIFFFQAQLAPAGTMSKPPSHHTPPLWSEILTASTQSLSMKGQLFPALCRPAQASARCSLPCSDPPTHTPKVSHTLSQTHTQSRLVWKNEMPLPEGVRLRGHSTKLCPHC